jgi:hypothetical protein
VSERETTWMFGDQFCRSALVGTTGTTRQWRHWVAFVIPSPPPGEELPDSTALAQRLCRLRVRWLENLALDSTAVEQAALELHRPLDKILGPGRAGVFFAGPGTGTWVAGRSWIQRSPLVVVAADRGALISDETDSMPTIVPPAVIAIAYVPGNGIEPTVDAMIDKTRYPKVDPEELAEMARGDSAIGWSRVSGLAPLQKLFEHYRDSTRFDSTGRVRPDSSIDSLLLHALATLRDTVSLQPPQRSAALLAADLAVNIRAHWLDYKGQDTVYRQQLEHLGAKYQYAQMGAVWQYVRPWLWRAYQLDSLSPAGRAALVELERVGWTTEVGCGGAIDVVIQQGERALGITRADPLLHLYVADAYADIFSFRPDSVPASAPDSVRLQATKSESARLRAIEHYREALGGVRDAGLRQSIWNKAVRLMLNRVIDHRYYCALYD